MSQHFIGGQWIASDGAIFASRNPVTQDIVWQGHSASVTTVDAAVRAARSAFSDWSGTLLETRVSILREFARLLGEHQASLAHTIGFETGKPMWEAATEVATMIGKIDISIRAHQERTGTRETTQADHTAVLRHRPHGVVAVFGPYNFSRPFTKRPHRSRVARGQLRDLQTERIDAGQRGSHGEDLATGRATDGRA